MRLRILTILAVTAALCGLKGSVNAADDSTRPPVSVLEKLVGDNNTATQTTADGLQISSKDQKGKSFSGTTTRFKTPLIINVRAKTDSTSLRLTFGPRGMVILNWDLHPDDLSHHDPKTGKQTTVAHQGAVPKDTFVDVRWTIDEKGSRIEVDGVERANFAGDDSGLAGIVGIGSWGTAVVTVSSFTVTTQNPTPTPQGGAAPKSNRAAQRNYSVDASSGPATRLSKLQSEIKALEVIEQPSGEMLGEARDFILTGTRGKPKGDSIPVRFTSAVGPESMLVLDDVLRAISVKYPDVEASRFDLSYEDKYVGHEGPSIGAACGTLLLSLIQGFDIDPNLAITGDVSADAKIRAIGGVAAKIRGATAAKCNIVALPSENYDQVVDAFVYEGPGLLTNMQVISISNLDQAVAIARLDRTPQLKEAIDDFGDIQQILRATPAHIHDKDIADKLGRVLELAPNHYSAKLLLLLSQNKQPKKLSAAATCYYTSVAVQTMMPSLTQHKATYSMATPVAVQDGLKKLQKARWYADPQVLQYVIATQEFMQCMSDVQENRSTQQVLQAKAQAVVDEADKLNDDRDFDEKMLHEGI